MIGGYFSEIISILIVYRTHAKKASEMDIKEHIPFETNSSRNISVNVYMTTIECI